MFTQIRAGALIWLVLFSLSIKPVAADDDPIAAKLNAAKATFRTEFEEISRKVLDIFDRQEASLTAAGKLDALDRLRAERRLFEDGELFPMSVTPALQKRYLSIASSLSTAYSTAFKAYIKANKETQSRKVEKEMQAAEKMMQSTLTRNGLLGTWKLTMGSYSSDWTFFPDGTMDHSVEKLTCSWRIDWDNQVIEVWPKREGGRNNLEKIYLPLNPRETNGQSWRGTEFKLVKSR